MATTGSDPRPALGSGEIDYRYDIKRIADALEKLVEHAESRSELALHKENVPRSPAESPPSQQDDQAASPAEADPRVGLDKG